MGVGMSTVMSSIVVLALFVLVVAPLILTLYRTKLRWAVGAFYLVFATGVAAYHIELPADLPRPARPVTAASGMGARCHEALELSEQAGIILERKDPARLVVSKTSWPQVPKQVQDALIACHRGEDMVQTTGVLPRIVLR